MLIYCERKKHCLFAENTAKVVIKYRVTTKYTYFLGWSNSLLHLYMELERFIEKHFVPQVRKNNKSIIMKMF
jgi:hypothetical protein